MNTRSKNRLPSDFVTPHAKKNGSTFLKPMASVKRTSSFAFTDSPFVVPPSPMMRKLGVGTQVTVYRYKRQKCSDNDSASPWAIKKSKLGVTRAPVLNRLTTEGAIMRQLDHPNIVKFKKLTKSEGVVCLAMEAFGKGLDDLIVKRQQTGELFRSKQIMKVAWSIAKALYYLHNTMHLLHGDIKSGNILVQKDFEEIKLCDFGVSILMKEDLSGPKNPKDTYTGSEPWLSKEIINDKLITDKADIFAYGLVIWEMLALDVPHTAWITGDDTRDSTDLDGSYSDTNDKSIDSIPDEYFKALGTRPPLPDINYPEDYMTAIGTFICCTCENYKERPNAAKIVQSLTQYYKAEEEEEESEEVKKKVVLTPKADDNIRVTGDLKPSPANGTSKELFDKTPDRTEKSVEYNDELFKTPIGREEEKEN